MASDRVFSAHMLHILLIQERITLVQTNSKVEAYTSYIRIPADAMTTHGMGMVPKSDDTCERRETRNAEKTKEERCTAIR